MQDVLEEQQAVSAEIAQERPLSGKLRQDV
jgi:hypothetical protein